MAVANDDNISAAINRPCGFARYATNSSLQNFDSAPATGKTLAQCKGKPNRVLLTTEAQAIRWTDDPDVDPTSTVGMPLAVGATLEYTGDLSKFRWIEATAGAVVSVSYYNS